MPRPTRRSAVVAGGVAAVAAAVVAVPTFAFAGSTNSPAGTASQQLAAVASGSASTHGVTVRGQRLTAAQLAQLRRTGQLFLSVTTKRGRTVEVMVQRGVVVAASATSVSVRSVDGAVVSYALVARTKIREGRTLVPASALQPGQHVQVIGVQRSRGDVAGRIRIAVPRSVTSPSAVPSASPSASTAATTSAL